MLYVEELCRDREESATESSVMGLFGED